MPRSCGEGGYCQSASGAIERNWPLLLVHLHVLGVCNVRQNVTKRADKCLLCGSSCSMPEFDTSVNGLSCAVQLYTQEFYENVVKQKLNPGGIFVTQSGPAGVLSASQVLTLTSLPYVTRSKGQACTSVQRLACSRVWVAGIPQLFCRASQYCYMGHARACNWQVNTWLAGLQPDQPHPGVCVPNGGAVCTAPAVLRRLLGALSKMWRGKHLGPVPRHLQPPRHP